MMRRLTILLLWATLALPAITPAFAVEPSEQLADPVLEHRARVISGGLRCLVCRNESIDESDASLAHDIRILLRERLTAGDSDAQAVQFIVDRYGEYVLLKPPVEPATYALWFGPPALLVLVGGLVWLAVRRRRVAPGPVPAPLQENERQQLAQLLREGEP